MERIKVRDAVGQVLCHDVTRIVKGDEAAGTAGFKGAQFRKGHVIREEDIPVLLSMGKEHVYVWELGEGMLQPPVSSWTRPSSTRTAAARLGNPRTSRAFSTAPHCFAPLWSNRAIRSPSVWPSRSASAKSSNGGKPWA